MVPVSARVTAGRNRLFSLGRGLLLTGLLFAGFSGSAKAQYYDIGTVPDAFDDQSTSGVVFLGKKDGLLGPYNDTNYFGPYLHLRHIAGDGPGYRDNGYSSLGLFAPQKFFGGMLFTEGRLSVNDFGDMLVSAGSGYRLFCEPWNRTFGASFWYDIDGGHDGTFTQIAVNAETRGENWDLFANAYLPVAEDDKRFNRIVTPTGQSFQQFQGQNIVLNMPNLILDQFESAMKGVDVEFGGPLPVIGKWGFRGYGGWYHYEKDGVADVNGGRFRVQAELTDAVTGQFTLTNDNQFDTSVIFGITWTIPGSGVNRGRTRMPPGLIRSDRPVIRAQSPHDSYSDGGRGCSFAESQWFRMFETVNRSDRVFVTRTTRTSLEDNFIFATDPITGQPIEIVHVDSRAAPGGDGSFELPFDTLAATQAGTVPGDTIFVHAGSVFEAPANNFIALQTNQQFLGEGVPHFINTAQLGLIPIPPSGQTGPLPLIDGAPANAITLADASLVSGFSISGSGGAGLFADGSLTGTANVDNTTINDGMFGVDVQGSPGTLNFAATTTINNSTAGNAFNVENAGVATQISYAGTINNMPGAGRAVNLIDLGAGSLVNFSGMVTDTGGTGIFEMGSAGSIVFADANLTIPVGAAVELDTNTATTRFAQLDVTTLAGTGLLATDGGTVVVQGGNIDATGGPAIDIDPTLVNLKFTNVSSTSSPTHGIRLVDTSGSLAIAGTATIFDPTMDGIHVETSPLTLDIANVDIDMTGEHGIFLDDNTGTFLFNAGSIDDAMMAPVHVEDGTALVAYRGDINHAVAAVAMAEIFDTMGGSVTFETGTLTATDGTGIQIDDAAGAIAFNGTTTLNGGDAGVDILGTGTGTTATIVFGPDATITDPTGVAFNVDNMDVAATITYAGTITQSNADFAVNVDDFGGGGSLNFTGPEVVAQDTSTGVSITSSGGNVSFNNLDMDNPVGAGGDDTQLFLSANTGVYTFDTLNVETDGTEAILAMMGGTFNAGSALTSNVTTNDATAISLTDTGVGAVTFQTVTATMTAGNDALYFEDVGNGGTFTIDDGDMGTVDDLTIADTGGGIGVNINGTGTDSTFTFSSADIDDTMGDTAIEIVDITGTVNFGVTDILNSDRGIDIDGITGAVTFETTNIENTNGFFGVRIDGVSMGGSVTFDDGIVGTTPDLTITDTGGADGIHIDNNTSSATFTFSSVDVSDTAGGDGIDINGGSGDFTFGDGSAFTPVDITVSNTGAGNGIDIFDTSLFASISFDGVSIDDTAIGINIDSVRGDVDFGDTAIDMTTGTAINMMDTGTFADVTFASTTLTTVGTDGITLTDNAGDFVTSGGAITVGAGQTGVLASNTSTNGDVTVDGLTIDGGDAGIDISGSGTSTFQVLINNTTIGMTTPPTDGVILTNTGTGTLSATITGNDVTDGGGDGLIAETAAGATMQLNIGTNMASGTTVTAGLENEFSADYVFINAGMMELGVTDTITTIGNPINNADIDDELNAFNNTTAGGGTSVTPPAGNQLDAVDPNTIPPP